METKLSILNILKKNCKYSVADIATMHNISEAEAAKIIAELEDCGAIIKYCALVNEEVINKQKISAIIEVKVTPERGKGFDAVAERIYNFSEVTSCYLVSGDCDLYVIIEGTDLKEISLFVAEKLATIEGVISTNTHFMLKRYKFDGEVMFKKSNGKRLAVTP